MKPDRPRLFLSPPHMSGTEQDYVREAFASNYIAPLGPMVDAFEREFSAYSGIPHALALSSGTAALQLALRCLGIGRGDRVLAPTLTFIGGVSPILFEGAEPLFVDADPATWALDPKLVDAAMVRSRREGRPVRAVVACDLYGQCADYDALRALCDREGAKLIADAAEAMGATYKGRHAGFHADAAVYSFNGNKIITTSGGGMLASHDRAPIEHARKLSQQAREPAPHYEHVEIGYNYRMSNIVAAIGRGQLGVLDDRVAARRRIFARYVEGLSDLPGVSFMPEAAYGCSNRWLTVLLVDPAVAGIDREKIRLALEAENIEARPVWKPMHLQPVFAECLLEGGAVAASLFERGLCLPSGSAMTGADIDRVTGLVRAQFGTA